MLSRLLLEARTITFIKHHINTLPALRDNTFSYVVLEEEL